DRGASHYDGGRSHYDGGAVTMTAGAVTMTTSAPPWPACCGETSCGLRDGRARPRDVIRADRRDGRSLPRVGWRRPELPGGARGMWPAPSSLRPASTGALPASVGRWTWY